MDEFSDIMQRLHELTHPINCTKVRDLSDDAPIEEIKVALTGIGFEDHEFYMKRKKDIPADHTVDYVIFEDDATYAASVSEWNQRSFENLMNLSHQNRETAIIKEMHPGDTEIINGCFGSTGISLDVFLSRGDLTRDIIFKSGKKHDAELVKQYFL